MTADGTVYLLHFEHPYKGRSRHYLGFTRNLEQRLESHRVVDEDPGLIHGQCLRLRIDV